MEARAGLVQRRWFAVCTVKSEKVTEHASVRRYKREIAVAESTVVGVGLAAAGTA